MGTGIYIVVIPCKLRFTYMTCTSASAFMPLLSPYPHSQGRCDQNNFKVCLDVTRALVPGGGGLIAGMTSMTTRRGRRIVALGGAIQWYSF